MGRIDIADIRACRTCGVECLYLPEVEAYPLYLDPHVVVDGTTVTDGYRLEGRMWFVHLGRTSHPAFRVHECAANNRKGTTRMTESVFAQAAPPGASGPKMEEYPGRLVLLDVHQIKRNVTTPAGVSDCVVADVVFLDNGESHSNAALWGKVLVNQFAEGNKYVGRIGKGVAQAGKSAPWEWTNGDANDQQVAVAYLNHTATQAVSTQAAPAQPVVAASAAPVTAPWIAKG